MKIRSTVPWLLFLATLACLAVALAPRRSQHAKLLYLHLYSTQHSIHNPPFELEPHPRENECIATIAIVPGVEFYADLPNHHEPSMQISGKVTNRHDSIGGAFRIIMEDSGLSIVHDQTEPMPLNVLAPIDPNDEVFLAISNRDDPYSLDYKIE